jgi:hypothetical protein
MITLIAIALIFLIIQIISSLITAKGPSEKHEKYLAEEKCEQELLERNRPAIDIPIELGPLFNFELEGKTVAEWRQEHGLPDKKEV